MAADDDDSGDDGDSLDLDKAEIKKFFKIAGTRSLMFAFVPGAGQDDPLFTIHRRMKPKKLGTDARKEAEETKVGYGELTVEGKVVVLKCQKLIPSMGKKLKKFLRKKKVAFEVKVLDANGAEVA